MSPRLRLAATLVVSALAIGYILFKIDIGQTLHILGSADQKWVLVSAFLILVTILPMAWRWQQLLGARGIHEGLSWLTRAYFVSYAVGQVLPTSVGGDASRIYETSRRHPGQITPVTGSVLLERALGGAVTLLLAGIGFLLAIGRYDIGGYLWIEFLFVVATLFAGVVFSHGPFVAGSCSRFRSHGGCASNGSHVPSTTASMATAIIPAHSRSSAPRPSSCSSDGFSRSTRPVAPSASTCHLCRTSCSARCSSS